MGLESEVSGVDGLPKSSLEILSFLVTPSPLCPKEISEKLGYAPRTVSFALKKLLDKKMVRKRPNLNDMRQWLYLVNEKMVKSSRDYSHLMG
jgi:DNA-binding MarR family transcriptional regulator